MSGEPTGNYLDGAVVTIDGREWRIEWPQHRDGFDGAAIDSHYPNNCGWYGLRRDGRLERSGRIVPLYRLVPLDALSPDPEEGR